MESTLDRGHFCDTAPFIPLMEGAVEESSTTSNVKGKADFYDVFLRCVSIQNFGSSLIMHKETLCPACRQTGETGFKAVMRGYQSFRRFL